MLEARSPILNGAVTHHGVTLSEALGFTLTQIAGDEKAFKKVYGKLAATVGAVTERDNRQFFRIGPKQFWIVGAAPETADGIYITPLSSGRIRLLLEGEGARRVISSCALIDFHESQFKPGYFAMTGIHHTPVLIHCIGENSFHIYALRTFALNIWEWLEDIMGGLNHD